MVLRLSRKSAIAESAPPKRLRNIATFVTTTRSTFSLFPTAIDFRFAAIVGRTRLATPRRKTLADFFQGLDIVEINGLEHFERAIERCEFWKFEANVPNDVEDKFAKVEKRFPEKVVPFLERNRALKGVVNNYDAGSCESAPPEMRFDDFRFGVARFLLGQYAEAAAHFEAEAEKKSTTI